MMKCMGIWLELGFYSDSVVTSEDRAISFSNPNWTPCVNFLILKRSRGPLWTPLKAISTVKGKSALYPSVATKFRLAPGIWDSCKFARRKSHQPHEQAMWLWLSDDEFATEARKTCETKELSLRLFYLFVAVILISLFFFSKLVLGRRSQLRNTCPPTLPV